MRKINFIAFASLIGFICFNVVAAEDVSIVNSSLKAKMAICDEVYKNNSDNGIDLQMACPEVQKYVFKKFSLKKMRQFFSQDYEYELKEVSLKVGVDLIINSFREQVEVTAVENLTAGEEEREMKAVNQMRKVVTKIEKLLLAAGKNAKVFIDEDIEWAPRTPGVVMVLVYPGKGTATRIMHGDLGDE